MSTDFSFPVKNATQISKKAAAGIFTVLCFAMISCGENNTINKQPIDQYNIDESNDYKYIFRDQIKEQKEEEKKNEASKKGPFKD